MRSLALKLAASAAALALGTLVWSAGTWSAFDRTASSPGNAVAAGTVALADNDGGAPLLSLTGARSGSSVSSCVKVTNSGSLPVDVRTYGTVGGSGLAPYLTLTVTRGTIAGAPAAKSCTGFAADETDYLGKGAGVVYSGTLSAFPGSASTALVDPTSAVDAEWAAGEAHAYKLTVAMTAGGGVGLTATAGFTWLATST